MGIVKAMRETGIVPDFIVVDGAEGGTGASPLEFSDHIGVPMREGLLFVHNTLVGAGLRDQIRIGAAGKVVSAFDIAACWRSGADWTNAGRGFMFAIGCIQSLTCNTNRCPTGVATQDPMRQRALVVAGQGRAGLQLPPQHPAGPVRDDRRGGARASRTDRPAPSGAARRA